MVRAYSISADAIDRERSRVGDDLSRYDFSRVLELEEIELPPPGPDAVRLRILAASLEHNIVHAAIANTVNIVKLRGGKIYPGNCFVAEVVETGSRATRFRSGDIVLASGTARTDPYGYPATIWAYDDPDSVGCYCEETNLAESQLILAPLDCGLNLWQLAATPLRGATAFHLWRRGDLIFRAKVPREKLARTNVLGFGGGTSEFFLMLARSEGHRAFYCSGNAGRRSALAEMGIETIDQTAFNRFQTEQDVARFRRAVLRLTGGEGAHVVCDNLRGRVFDAAIAACAREGVIVSAGWQLGRTVAYNSAAMTIRQITLDHCHFETVDGCHAAIALLGTVFRPHLHKEIYAFEDLPRGLQELHQNRLLGMQVVQVARDLPQAVRPYVPGA